MIVLVWASFVPKQMIVLMLQWPSLIPDGPHTFICITYTLHYHVAYDGNSNTISHEAYKSMCIHRIANFTN